MSLSAALTLMFLQVGPNPNASTLPDTAEELRNRPPRMTNEIAPSEPTDPLARWLSRCLDLVDTDPARAHSQAQIRRAETSGAERVIANHCLGLAATNLGLWNDAQTAFTSARDETPAEELRARSRFGTMAGNAALAGGDMEAALTLFNTAETEARGSGSGTLEAIAATDRARVLVALERPSEALEALGNAAKLMPESPEVWLYMATLQRRQDRLVEAQESIEKAGELAPLNPQIGLEAGVIAALAGRDDAARKSLQSVIDTNPDSPQAKAARAYLDQLGPATPAP